MEHGFIKEFQTENLLREFIYNRRKLYGIDADTKECDDALGVICFRASFEMIEEFEKYMIELIV